MKKTLLLLLFSGFSFLAISQGPKKKDTRIMVSPADTTNLLNRISIALFESGYNPDVKDPAAGIILTKEKDFRTYSVRIRVLIADTSVTFSGQGRFFSLVRGDKDDDFEDIHYGGTKGSDLRNAWDQVESIARQFGTITHYTK